MAYVLASKVLMLVAGLFTITSVAASAQETGWRSKSHRKPTRIPVAVDWESGSLEPYFWATDERAILFYYGDPTSHRRLHGLEVDIAHGNQAEIRGLNSAFLRHEIISIDKVSQDHKLLLCRAARRSDCTILGLDGAIHGRQIKQDNASSRVSIGSLDASHAVYLDRSDPRTAEPPQSNIMLYTVALHDDTAVTERRIQLPVKSILRGLLISPKKNRLAWMLEVTPEVGEFDEASRRSTDYEWSKVGRQIWVSGIDGTSMKLVYDEQPIVKRGEQPELLTQLQWLPGGNRLSFVVRHALYTVPID